jgi:hypothetical protein
MLATLDRARALPFCYCFPTLTHRRTDVPDRQVKASEMFEIL